jgi:hypothetical protein
MYLLARPLNLFASAEQSALQFTALNFDGDNVIVEGKVLYLHHIHDFVETLISEIKDHLNKQLFFDLDIIDTSWVPGLIHEEPQNTGASYSAYDDARNAFHQHKTTLLEAILTHPRLRGRFHYRDNDDRIVWKAGPCFAYMDIAHQVEMKLFAASQATVSEVGRGTELASHLIRNIPGGTVRNILHMFQFFVMLATYNKSSTISEAGHAIARVPLPEVGRLWTIFHTFVRPLLVIWQRHFNGPRAASRFHYSLFGGPFRAVTSSELSLSLSTFSFRLLGIKMSLRLWRHVLAWFLNHNAAHFEKHLSHDNQDIYSIMMGHSSQAHQLYASDGRLPRDTNHNFLFKTMTISGVWHHLLGFPPTLLEAMKRRPAYSIKTSPSPTSSDKFPIPNIDSISAHIAAEVRKSLSLELRQIFSHTRANDLSSFLHAAGIDLQMRPSRPLAQSVDQMVHPSRIRHLRQVRRDNHASFENAQQALAAELLASCAISLLLIGMTGEAVLSLDFPMLSRACRSNSAFFIHLVL